MGQGDGEGRFSAGKAVLRHGRRGGLPPLRRRGPQTGQGLQRVPAQGVHRAGGKGETGVQRYMYVRRAEDRPAGLGHACLYVLRLQGAGHLET